jgi:diguanylate cyclase (GGDEF)-like protein
VTTGGWRVSRSNAWCALLAVGLCVIAGYFALPGPTSQDAVYQAFGVGSVVCILLGVRIFRPEDRLSWYLLALGGLFFTLGDGAENYYGLILHESVPFPSVCDAFYLAGYPFVFAGILRLTRNPNQSARREDYADAAIIAIGALALSWHFLMNSYVDDASLTTVGKLVILAYPVMDIALVFVVCRALLFGTYARPVHRILAAALIVMFVADFTYDLLALHNAYATGNPVDGLFLFNYLLMGVAALHPSVVGRPGNDRGDAAERREVNSRRRMPFVALAGFVPPIILLVAAGLGVGVNVAVLAGFCLAEFALVYVRMMWMIGRIGRQNAEIEHHAGALQTSLTQRELLEADLRHLAFHDELTGLANRALLHERVEHALAATTRSGQQVALCFGDLDGFKTINDTLGHHVGDRVLVKAGELLASIVRPGDTVARLGGDEFAVLLEDVPDPQAAVEFARRIVSVLHGAVDLDGGKVGLSISVGVAFADPTKTTEQLISEADSAMYEAKSNGKNRVEVFRSAMRSRMLERLELTNGFRGALDRSEFFLQYQPIFSLADQQLVGFEALVRWRHPTLGLVEPLRFIPVAEETGFIVPLGRWVLFEACEQLATWSGRSGHPLTMSVNLSRRQLISPQLADDVRTALALSANQPGQLVLEITESVLMDDPRRANDALVNLRTIGVQIAVDDFGTGYSSLSHLQRFPVDELKIDKSFIDPLAGKDPQASALVIAIIALARSLDLRVVAEGIEHQGQLDHLRQLGCDRGQGYLMARPLDQQAASALIDAYAGSASPA